MLSSLVIAALQDATGNINKHSDCSWTYRTEYVPNRVPAELPVATCNFRRPASSTVDAGTKECVPVKYYIPVRFRKVVAAAAATGTVSVSWENGWQPLTVGCAVVSVEVSAVQSAMTSSKLADGQPSGHRTTDTGSEVTPAIRDASPGDGDGISITADPVRNGDQVGLLEPSEATSSAKTLPNMTLD